MSRRMYEFQCEAGHITENLVSYEVTTVPCGTCGNDAKRIISTPRISLDGTDPVYVSAHEKWAKNRESQRNKERKRNEA